MKNLLIIDGQGGQLGSQLIRSIKQRFSDLNLTAVGTNAAATASMLKAGANVAATGENPVKVACKTADIIIGPIGIVIADSLYGEVTPKMAKAIGKASAVRILLPINKCNNLIAGVPDLNMTTLMQDVLTKLEVLLSKEG